MNGYLLIRGMSICWPKWVKVGAIKSKRSIEPSGHIVIRLLDEKLKRKRAMTWACIWTARACINATEAVSQS